MVGRIFCRVLLMSLVVLIPLGCAAHHYRRALVPPGLAGPAPAIWTDHRIAIDAERVRLTKEYLRQHVPGFYATLPAADEPSTITFVPRMVVVHFTDIPTLEGTFATFAPPTIASDRGLVARNGQLNVGIQFVVDRDGTIYSLYPETTVARHVIGLNQVAIGIENVGTGDLDDPRAKVPLTQAQVDADAALIRYLLGKYPTIETVIGHSEYRDVENPAHPAHRWFEEAVPTYRTEKVDPGPRFMAALRQDSQRPATRSRRPACPRAGRWGRAHGGARLRRVGVL